MSRETLGSIEENQAARLAGNLDLYSALLRKIIALLGRGFKKCVRNLPEDVVDQENANDFRPAYRSLYKLRSNPASWMPDICKTDGCFVSDIDEEIAR